MDVLVRVEVGRIAADELPEQLELAADLALDLLGVLERHALVVGGPLVPGVGPLAKVEVKADRERGVGAGVLSRLDRRGPADHHAGAGHNPPRVGLDHARIDALVLAEVVRVDDQDPLARRQSLSSSAIPSASPRQSRRWSAGGSQPGGAHPSHWTAR